MGRRSRGRVWRCLACVSAVVAMAVPATPASGQSILSASLTFDNDGFNFWIPPRQRSDFFYTHGTHLDFVLASPPPLAGLVGARDRPRCGGRSEVQSCVVTRLRFSQQIYTPEDLFSPPPAAIFGDLGNIQGRPYAGWLSARLSGQQVTRDRSRSLAVELGITGGPSLGGAAHRAIHRWLGKAEPWGWEFQLPFEVAGAVEMRDQHVVDAFGDDRRASLTLLPAWWATLGTLRTGVGGELGARFGWNAPPNRVWASGLAGGSRFWASVVAGVEVELVAHDLFLDGSIWRQTLSTAREPILGRTRFGVEMGWGRVGLTFSTTRSSRAFRAQPEGHTFSTIALRLLG